MSSIRQFVYDNSPGFVQSLLVSVYGFYLRRLRYGKEYSNYLNYLGNAERLSGDEIEQERDRLLRQIVDNAIKHVPYYRQQFRGQELPTIRSPEDLRASFNVLDKQTLRDAPEMFHSRLVSSKDCETVFTSGTTGSPLEVRASRVAIARNFAFFSNFLTSLGLDPFAVSATFAGRLIVPQSATTGPYWRCNRATNTWLFSSYHLNSRTIPEYIRQLEKVKPTFIDSYPSSIWLIANYILSNSVNHAIRPRAIVTSSETLTVRCREDIEKAFGCPVYDQYGCAEMSVFVYQCNAGNYHSHPLYGLVEVLDDSGEPCALGERGSLVVTGYLNHAMPLIRYRIGDEGVLLPGRCQCGRTHPLLGPVLGREDDYIVTPEGNRVGRLDPLFKGFAGILEAQIVQTKIDSIVVRVVPLSSFDMTLQRTLIERIKDRVGNSCEVTVELVESIPRERSGKFRSVVSKVAAGQTNR